MLIKANGEMTYFMSDVAYHYNKMERGFDHLINIWGADHHGYIARCEAMLAAWGWPGALEIVLGQLVNLFRDGEAVRMSKRTGEMITFEELIDEVGVDATRYLMLAEVLRPAHRLRHRGGEEEGRVEPGVLRAVRACAHLLHPAQGSRPGRCRGRRGRRDHAWTSWLRR